MDKKDGILLFDGAFGTLYGEMDGKEAACEKANLTEPDLVKRIHFAYLNAGADAIKTNTFGANSLLFPDEKQLEAVLQAGFRLALETAAGRAKVFADIGCVPGDEAEAEYLSLAKRFLSFGATNFLFETLDTFAPLLPALKHIKSQLPQAYIIVSFAVSQDGYTKKGRYYQDLLSQAALAGCVDAAGLNCICGPSHMKALIQELRGNLLPISTMPNAGYPSSIGGRTVYRSGAGYFAEKLKDMAAMGATILGGCCGTTPEHIAAAAKLLKGASSSQRIPSPKTIEQQKVLQKNRFREALQAGKRVIAVELDPPLGVDCGPLLDMARMVREAGADVITLADSPLARPRADSMLLSAKVRREVGIEVLPHMSCRDRNLIGIKASLLGGSIEGVQNLLAITGDPVTKTERVDVKGVFGLSSYDLISFVNRMNYTEFLNAPYFVGGALNINALFFANELKRAVIKQQKGAAFFLTQAVFSQEAAENVRQAKATLSVPVLAGILPIAGYKNAVFLNNEVTGITVDEALIQALEGKDREKAKEISLSYSQKTIDSLWEQADGFYLMTPLKRIDLICSLIRYIKQKELL